MYYPYLENYVNTFCFNLGYAKEYIVDSVLRINKTNIIMLFFLYTYILLLDYRNAQYRLICNFE